MERSDFSKPIHVTTWMGFFLALVALLAAVLVPQLKFAFLANVTFNSVILIVFFFGVAINLAHIWKLQREVLWIESFSNAGPEAPHSTKPVLLAGLAKFLASRNHESQRLTPAATRSILDGVQIRLEEQRDLSRYIIGALIFLGLLGTFWGLLVTVRSVGDIIGSMSGGGNAIETFEILKAQLDAPLGGMATSFACSLFGLAGSLVVGFLDLNTGHAQNRFYHELDQWLATLSDKQGSSEAESGEEAQLSADVRAELRRMTSAIAAALGGKDKTE